MEDPRASSNRQPGGRCGSAAILAVSQSSEALNASRRNGLPPRLNREITAVVEDVVDLLQTAAVIARRKAGEERREPRWPPLDVGIQLKTPPRPPARLFRRRGERMFERLKAAEQLRNVEGLSPVIGVGSSGKQGADLTGTLMRGKERLFDWNGTRSPGMKN